MPLLSFANPSLLVWAVCHIQTNARITLNPLNAKLNPICHLLALLGAHPVLHISRIRVNIYLQYLFLHMLVHNKQLVKDISLLKIMYKDS